VASDEVAWVFVGVLIGVGIGLPLGLILGQLILPRPSTVLIERTEKGYIIHER